MWMLKCLGGVSEWICQKVSSIVVHQNSGRGRGHRFYKKKRKRKVGSFYPRM